MVPTYPIMPSQVSGHYAASNTHLPMAEQPMPAVLQWILHGFLFQCTLVAKAVTSLYYRLAQAASAGGSCEGDHEAAPNSPNGDSQVTHHSLAGYYIDRDSRHYILFLPYYAEGHSVKEEWLVCEWLVCEWLVCECVHANMELVRQEH